MFGFFKRKPPKPAEFILRAKDTMAELSKDTWLPLYRCKACQHTFGCERQPLTASEATIALSVIALGASNTKISGVRQLPLNVQIHHCARNILGLAELVGVASTKSKILSHGKNQTDGARPEAADQPSVGDPAPRRDPERSGNY